MPDHEPITTQVSRDNTVKLKAAAKAPPPVPAAPPARFTRRQRLRRILLIAGPALVLLVGAYFYVTGGRYAGTDNAYVGADNVTIGTDVAGIVAEVAVKNNQTVEAGQLLFRLDDAPYRLALAGADAQLGIVRDQIQSLRATYRQRQEDINLAQTDIEFFRREFERQQTLATRNVASQAQLDQARHNLSAAQARIASLRQEAASTLASLGGDVDQPVEQNSNYLAAKAKRDQAARDLSHATVTAPTAGIVTNVDNLRPGEYLQVAAAAFNLVATDHVWVDANFKETDLTYVQPGQKATVTVDTYPGRVWQASVETLSPATGAEFALLPPQNATGNWVKVVQRIPVRIRLDTPPDAPPLRSGMSVNVEIDTGHERPLLRFISNAFARTGIR